MQVNACQVERKKKPKKQPHEPDDRRGRKQTADDVVDVFSLTQHQTTEKIISPFSCSLPVIGTIDATGMPDYTDREQVP
jgi:hypothetical protein